MLKTVFGYFCLSIIIVIFVLIGCTSVDFPTTDPLSDSGLFTITADPFTREDSITTNEVISNFFKASGGLMILSGTNYTYNYSISGILPSGLSSGDIGFEGFAVTGNPAAGTLGHYNYTIYAEDALGFKIQRSYKLDVNMVEDSESTGAWSKKSNADTPVIYQDQVHVLQGSYATKVTPKMTQTSINDSEALWFNIPLTNQDFSSGSGIISFYYYLTRETDVVVYLVDDAGEYWYNNEEVNKSVSTTNWHSFKKNVLLAPGGFTDGSAGPFNTASIKSVFILLYESAVTNTQVHYSWPFWVDSFYIEN